MDNEYINKIEKLTPRELKREIRELYDRLNMREEENEQLKRIVQKLMNAAKDESERLELRKKANDALNDALLKADEIIKEAREAAEKIINRANIISKTADNTGDSKFTLPGSKDLMISDDLLKGNGGSCRSSSRVIQEYFPEDKRIDMDELNKKSNSEGWREIVDSLHK